LYVTEQRPTPGLVWVSEHRAALKLPAPFDAKWTTPVGVLACSPAVSVTVAEQSTGCPTATRFGEQLTLVDVERSLTVTTVLSMLPVCVWGDSLL
jgi:hypothetical protein